MTDVKAETKTAVREWLGFAVAALTLSLVTWQFVAKESRDFRNDILHRFTSIDSQLVRLDEHVESHELKAAIHIADIVWNRERIIELMTNPAARPNSFSSDDAEKMRKELRNEIWSSKNGEKRNNNLN